MPTYLYKHPKTGRTKEVVQSMSEPHRYVSDGVEWERQFTVPNASIDTVWDPLSARDFVDKTKNKRGTLGDLYDKSKELSLERNRIVGKDDVKESHYKKYEKETGKKHPHRERKKEVKIDLAKKKVL